MTRSIICWFILFAAQSVQAQSLEESVIMTLRTNPDVQASKYSVNAAQEQKRQARAAYLPSLDLTLSTGRENSNNTTTRAASVRTGRDDLWVTRRERSLKLTQLLYDGFSTTNNIKQRQALVDSAAARLSGVQEGVSLRAIQVYLEILRRNEVVKLAVENLNHHDETLGKIRERFESGVGTKVDVVQTSGRRAQSKSNVLLSQRDARNGLAEFYRVVGESPSGLSQPDPISGLPATLDQAVSMAQRQNPEVVAAEADLLAAKAGSKQAAGVFHPRFDLELGATRNDDTDGTLGANDDETAVIRMTFNLFRGGADKARKNEAEAKEFAAREVLRSIKLAVEEDTTLVWNELEDIQVRLEYLRVHVESTEEVLAVYKEQLSLGKRTLLDLLDVQNELLRAKVAFISGQYGEKLARYRVLASTGELLETMGISPQQ